MADSETGAGNTAWPAQFHRLPFTLRDLCSLKTIGPNSRRFIIFKSTDYLNLLTTIKREISVIQRVRAYCSQQI